MLALQCENKVLSFNAGKRLPVIQTKGKLLKGLMARNLLWAQAPFCFPAGWIWEESGGLAALSLTACDLLILSQRFCDIGALSWSSKRIGWASSGTQKKDQHKPHP